MIISRINGGLGNQMFQYAIGKNLALRHKTELVLDLSLFHTSGGQTKRTFMLDEYHIDAKTLRSPKNLLGKSLQVAADKVHAIQDFYEKSFDFDPHVLSLGNNTRLNGYWQSHRYTDRIRRQLMTQFKPRQPVTYPKAVVDILSTKNSVSVHVRRGDYVTNAEASTILGVLPLTYYEQAISYIKAHSHDPYFIVFSDDIDWCQKQMSSLFAGNVIYHHGSQIEDLDIMTKTRHNIIANSSYSWWGAYLGEKETVISPKHWFKSKSTHDLIPDSWIQL